LSCLGPAPASSIVGRRERDLLVVAKIAVDGAQPSSETAALIDRAEAAVRAQVPQARLMFLEPDIDRRMPATPKAQGGSS
jgi:hypothetical protein